jgi:hypothetical protein
MNPLGIPNRSQTRSSGPRGCPVVWGAVASPEASSTGTGAGSPIRTRKFAATSRAPAGRCPLMARLVLAVKATTTIAAPSRVLARRPADATSRALVPRIGRWVERMTAAIAGIASSALACSSGVAAARTAWRSSSNSNSRRSLLGRNGSNDVIIAPSLNGPDPDPKPWRRQRRGAGAATPRSPSCERCWVECQ